MATLTLSPFKNTEPGKKKLVLTVGQAPFEKVVTAVLEVSSRPLLAMVETDRPIYRPGGEVAFRVLALDAINRSAQADEPVGLTVYDTQQRLLASFSATTREFGEATFTLPLAFGIAEGRYSCEARIGEERAEANFEVEELRLPPFRLEVNLGQSVFAAGSPVTAEVTATTFTGEPLSDAMVHWSIAGGGDRSGHLRLTEEGKGSISIPPAEAGTHRCELTVMAEQAGARTHCTRKFTVRPNCPPAFGIETEFGHDRRNGYGMANVGLAGSASLTLMGTGAKLEGMLNLGALLIIQITELGGETAITNPPQAGRQFVT